ncbi:MAG: response regulator [Candidatus Electryonea clarkiae]|nr:response regulator [Candidatus Electryonea clarkiae]MDP8286814.1 response regulator [Candidatus Electryonea clarkiae]
MKILVADDSRIIRTLIKKILEPYENYEIIEASDGVETLKKIKQVPGIGLVLMDYNMPNMNGLITLSEIRKRKASQFLPVIMITSEGGSKFVVKTIKLGANDFIVKPIDAVTLVRKIENILSKDK